MQLYVIETIVLTKFNCLNNQANGGHMAFLTGNCLVSSSYHDPCIVWPKASSRHPAQLSKSKYSGINV